MKASAFSQALRYHLEWKKKFRKFLEGKGDMAVSEIVSPEKCRLGKWLSSPEMSRYASTPEIWELEKLHKELHGSAQRIYEFKRAGDLSASRRELKEFDDICMRLVSLLTTQTIHGISETEEPSDSLMSLFNNFLFRKSFLDFFHKMQQDGIEAARTFWYSHPYTRNFPPQTLKVYEKLIDFFADMSLIPQTGYEKLISEHERLRNENTFLTETFMRLQQKIFAESGEKVREAWEKALSEQIEMNKGIAEKFLNLFVDASTAFYGKGTTKPFKTRRREMRHTYNAPLEFVFKDDVDTIVKSVVMNISESGLCINSSIPLSKGQEIMIRTSLPSRHKAFTVQWTNATIAGLSS